MALRTRQPAAIQSPNRLVQRLVAAITKSIRKVCLPEVSPEVNLGSLSFIRRAADDLTQGGAVVSAQEIGAWPMRGGTATPFFFDQTQVGSTKQRSWT